MRVDVGSSISSPEHLCSKLKPCDRGHDFTYEPPEILRLSPSRGSSLGGTVILISGKNVGGSGETRVSFVKTSEQTCSGESLTEKTVKDLETCEQECRDSTDCQLFSFSIARSTCRLHSSPSKSSNKAVSTRDCFLKREESISVKIGGGDCTLMFERLFSIMTENSDTQTTSQVRTFDESVTRRLSVQPLRVRSVWSHPWCPFKVRSHRVVTRTATKSRNFSTTDPS